jgi:hypothetical protein
MILPLKNIWKFSEGFCGLIYRTDNTIERFQYQESWNNRTTHYYYMGVNIFPRYEGIQIIWCDGNLFGLKENYEKYEKK